MADTKLSALTAATNLTNVTLYGEQSGASRKIPAALIEPAGTASTALAAHVAAGDPHTQYALESALGDAASKNVGTSAGTVAAGDHAHSGVYALAAHAHAIADTTGLQTALDAKAPTASPTFTGTITADGASIVPTYAITGGVVQTTKRRGVLALTGNQTLTFDTTPPAANALFDALVHADGTDRTVTIPESKSFLRGGLITSFVVPANGSVLVSWYYTGSTLHIYGDPMTAAQVKTALAITGSDVSGVTFTAGSNVTLTGSWPSLTIAATGGGGGGSGDVTAAAVIADNAIVRGDGGAKGVQGSTPTINDAGEIEVNADGNPGYLILKDAHATAPKQIVTTAPVSLTTDQVYVEPATGGTVGQVKRVASLTGNVRTEEWVFQGSATPQTISAAGAVNAASGVVICTGTSYTITLPAANAATPNALLISIINAATGDIIIDPAGSETIEGETTATLQPGNRFTLASNNSNAWYLV